MSFNDSATNREARTNTLVFLLGVKTTKDVEDIFMEAELQGGTSGTGRTSGNFRRELQRRKLQRAELQGPGGTSGTGWRRGTNFRDRLASFDFNEFEIFEDDSLDRDFTEELSGRTVFVS